MTGTGKRRRSQKYPDELRERAVRMVLEIRQQTGERHGAVSTPFTTRLDKLVTWSPLPGPVLAVGAACAVVVGLATAPGLASRRLGLCQGSAKSLHHGRQAIYDEEVRPFAVLHHHTAPPRTTRRADPATSDVDACDVREATTPWRAAHNPGLDRVGDEDQARRCQPKPPADDGDQTTPCVVGRPAPDDGLVGTHLGSFAVPPHLNTSPSVRTSMLDTCADRVD